MADQEHPTDPRHHGLRFISRMHRMRMLGTLLCALPIASVLAERGAAPWVWTALAVNVLLWPHLARLLSRRAPEPVSAEYRNLVVDAGFGGIWIATTAISLLPAAVVVSVLTTDRLAAGGWRLLRWSTLALCLGFATTWLLLGRPFEPDMSLRTVVACLPLLFGYNVALSYVTHRFVRTIARQNRQLERMNQTDASSELPNRRHFDARAAQAHAAFQRSGRRAMLLVVDIDQFKAINDRYGHGIGDLVVKAVADVLRDTVRAIDVPARIGGDEFAVLLDDVDLIAAQEVGERIRATIAALAFDAEPALTCSVSIGIAEVRTGQATLQAWVQDADAALYRAKAAGRNRVVAA